jgi:hydroxyethylthiazole kinase
MKLTSNEFLQEAAKLINNVKEKSPLVHCITNFVTINDCANILLAFGASPAMCDAEDETYNFVKKSDSLYINLGTYIKEHKTSSIQAVRGAKESGKPIVVDPVGCGSIPERITAVENIHEISGIDIIKGNMAEITALADKKTMEETGVGSKDYLTGIEEAAILVAKKYHCIVAATGRTDIVTDGETLLQLYNGTGLLTKITGAGCMAGALCGATAAVCLKENMLIAAIAALLSISIAGEIAVAETNLPGSFKVKLIDTIYALMDKTIVESGKLAVKQGVVC